MTENVDILLITGIAITMLFSAFFSGMEIAFVSGNRMLFEMDKEKDGLSTRLIDLFYRHSNDFVSTMLVGNNIVLVVYGILIAELFNTTIFSGVDAAFTVPADTILSTLIVLFTGEFLPKTLFKSNPNRMLEMFSLIAFMFYIILWPISRFATFLSKGILRMVGVKVKKEQAGDEFSKVDLDYLVQSSIDNAKDDDVDDEVKIFQNALEFSDTKVRDCMIPRTEINAVEYNSSKDELMQKFIESGNSKIIVYHDDIDHIDGYIHSAEMFRNSTGDWHTSICKMPFVPETMTARKLMKIFLHDKRSLGIVVDEFGGTSGIVSLEDIVEEIFGDIEDEHDSNKYIAQKTENGEYLLSARLEIEKVNEMFDLKIPESEEYKTVGGFILYHYQSFPKLNEVVKIDNFSFKIIKSTMTKIELVRLNIEM
jgi:CBS domain containing-hemolysin-like protein